MLSPTTTTAVIRRFTLHSVTERPPQVIRKGRQWVRQSPAFPNNPYATLHPSSKRIEPHGISSPFTAPCIIHDGRRRPESGRTAHDIIDSTRCKKRCTIATRITSSGWNSATNKRATHRLPTISLPAAAAPYRLAEGGALRKDSQPAVYYPPSNTGRPTRHPAPTKIFKDSVYGGARRIRFEARSIRTKTPAQRGENRPAQSPGSLPRQLQRDHFAVFGSPE